MADSVPLDTSGFASGFTEKLRQRFGLGVDPEISLEGSGEGSGAAVTEASAELLARLLTHGPRSSRYRLEGEIARGGMGTILRVWDADLRRPLAMKVVLGSTPARFDEKAPAIEPRALSRFLEEAQVTAQLDHPGIVPVHELGLADDGHVYFTMRLVKGRDLREVFERVFAGDPQWSETRALHVMLRVCEALSYAHARGVVHRDLKPGNVMVGGFGEVYVMDWGLARVVGRKDSHDLRLAPETGALSSLHTQRRDERESDVESPLVTMDGDVIGTPAYMSPEQARGEVERIAPPTDVYAIGAMLYHLLARRMPYAPESGRISARTTLAAVIHGPPADLATIRKDIPAELAAIVEKAMARESGRRYATTLELADDLRAFLEHRVVHAYQSGAWAEARKWIERNRALAAALAAGVLLLAGGLTVSLIFKARAEENARIAELRRGEAEAAQAQAQAEKEAAQRSAAETRLVAEFQSRMLSDLSIDEFGHTILTELRAEIAQSGAKLGVPAEEIERAQQELDQALRHANATTVARSVLSKTLFEPAARTIDKEYADNELLAALLQAPLASTLELLSLYELGIQTADAALKTRRAALGDLHPETLDSISTMALLLRGQGRLSEAEPLFRELLAGRQALLGPRHHLTLTAVKYLGGLRFEQGRFDDAVALFRQALAGRRAELGDRHPDTLISLNDLGAVLFFQGDLAEAEPLLREALAGLRAELGDQDRETLGALGNLADLLRLRGQYDESEALSRENLASRRATLGDQHVDTLRALSNFGLLLTEQERLSEAEAMLQEALAGSLGQLGARHPLTLNVINNLAGLMERQGKLSEAELLYREVFDGTRSSLGEAHPSTLVAAWNLAFVLATRRNLSEAEALYRQTLPGFRTTFGEDHQKTLNTLQALAEVLQGQGTLAEAESLHLEVLEARRRTLGDQHADTQQTLRALVQLYQRWQSSEPTEERAARLEELRELLER